MFQRQGHSLPWSSKWRIGCVVLSCVSTWNISMSNLVVDVEGSFAGGKHLERPRLSLTQLDTSPRRTTRSGVCCVLVGLRYFLWINGKYNILATSIGT